MWGKPRPGSAARWLLLASAVALWACTRDFDELLTSSGSGAAAASSSGAGGMGSGASSGSPASAGGASSGASSSAAGTNAGGAGGAGAAGGDGVGGSGGSARVVQITCGAAVCDAPDVCCFTDQHTPRVAQACTPAAGCRAVPLSCDGPADCPSGQVCCGLFDYPNDLYVSIECQDACDGIDQLELCDLALPVCAFGGTCVASDNLGDPYGYCG